MINLDESTNKKLIEIQRSEITEHHIYKKLASIVTGENNKKILNQLSEEELNHYNIWKKNTGVDVKPNFFKVWLYFFVSKFFGLTFGLKLMEKGESIAQATYKELESEVEEAKRIEKDENEHELKIIDMIDEIGLKYVGSIVLGLNDALVELTGALAGLTFALQNSQVVALAGLITGIAASMSMAASEYLSIKSENRGGKNPVRAAIYTGIAYIVTVFFLIVPFLLLNNVFLSLGISLVTAVLIIALFTFYVSVAQEISFWKRFLEMAGLSLGVALFSFLIGMVLRMFFNVEL